jgi:hypothetical protein
MVNFKNEYKAMAYLAKVKPKQYKLIRTRDDHQGIYTVSLFLMRNVNGFGLPIPWAELHRIELYDRL